MTAPGHESLGLFDVAWRLGATLFFVALNGFFVAAEFALVKVRAARIEDLEKEGHRAARSVRHMLSHLDRYLSACQLGITLASLILGALGEPAVSVLLVAAARGLGFNVSAAGWVPFVSIGLAFTVITMLHMTVGEQAPKMLALQRSERTALRTALTLRIFAVIFGPFIIAVNGISNAMLRMVGLRADEGEAGHSAEEIRSILSLSARAGNISDHEYELTRNVFRMIDLEVRHIVVPRVDVEFLTLEHGIDESLARIRGTGHSRLPLCEVGLDTIVGFVHTKDVLARALDGPIEDLRPLARDPLYVPDTMALSDFLAEIQKKRQHCAAVVDEHGSTIGLAFLEDALEEIVGPLGDEFDEREFEFRHLAGGAAEITGRMPLPEVCNRLDVLLSADELEGEETLGGHFTARLGRLPTQGDEIEFGPFRATVLAMAGHRVDRVRLERRAGEAPPEPSEVAPPAAH